MTPSANDHLSALENGPMMRAIDEYRDYLLQTAKRPYAALRHAHYLWKNCTALGWKTTTDIPSGAFRLMEDQWTKPTARVSQFALAGFVRWARERYRINDALLTHQVTPRIHPRLEDDWDDADLHYVLGMMRGFDKRLGECPFPIIERCVTDRALQKASNLARGSLLFPITWLVSQFGIRRYELMTFRVGDWKPARMQLVIRHSATLLKTPREVTVDPATATVIERVSANRHPDEFLFRPRKSKRWEGVNLARQFQLFLQAIGMSGTLTMCHRIAVRSIMRRMPGDLKGAARMLGVSGPNYLKRFHDEPTRRIVERRRARALADELSALFHVPDPNAGQPQTSRASPALPTLQDILASLRPTVPLDGAPKTTP